MEEQTKDINDFIQALRRRKRQIGLVAGILLFASVMVAFFLPPSYRSSATILIEEQEIPPELVRSTITSFADQRIQVISQQVMTRTNLMQIIEKYTLYPSQRRRDTTEEVLARMTGDIRFESVSADVMDKNRGMKVTATIAFKLSYDGETPEVAVKVANELVSLYLNENLKSRQQKTAETSSFLTEEVERMNTHISELEAKLADFKKKNIGRLPEVAQLNLQTRDRTESEVMEADRQINTVQERKIYLEGQLAQIKPDTPMFGAGGERILGTGDRLSILKSQYASLSGVYALNHPDLVKMRREMASLEKESGNFDAQEQGKQIVKLRADLATLQDKYSPDHPDVVKLRKAVVASEEAQRQENQQKTDLRPKKPENPAYLTFQSQLESTISELKSLQNRRVELKAKAASYEARLQQSPEVEREYLDLSRDHENSYRRYQELKAKQLEAQVAQELEKGSKGERFSLIDPPQLPEKPHSPNRTAILLLGAILSLGGGVGYASLLESLDASIRGTKSLAQLSRVPVLAAIPYMENAQDRGRKRKVKFTGWIVGVVVFLVAISILHFFIMPLDVLWYKILRRITA